MSNTNKRVAALCLGVATMLVPAVMQAQTAALQGALNQLFRVAEQHNATLQSMQSAIDVAQAGVDAAQKAKLPDVEAQLSVSYLGDAWLWNRHFGESTKAPMPHFGIYMPSCRLSTSSRLSPCSTCYTCLWEDW